jgi:hypothetical protein
MRSNWLQYQPYSLAFAIAVKGRVHGGSFGLWQIPVKLKFKNLRRHRCRFGTPVSAL